MSGGTSLPIQWLRVHASNAGDTGSIPYSQETIRSHMLHSTIKKKKAAAEREDLALKAKGTVHTY